jgi:hypothetical protein
MGQSICAENALTLMGLIGCLIGSILMLVSIIKLI